MSSTTKRDLETRSPTTMSTTTLSNQNSNPQNSNLLPTSPAEPPPSLAQLPSPPPAISTHPPSPTPPPLTPTPPPPNTSLKGGWGEEREAEDAAGEPPPPAPNVINHYERRTPARILTTLELETPATSDYGVMVVFWLRIGDAAEVKAEVRWLLWRRR
ncbi:formin-like protein 20 [Helianthus annuus]|uniref:formin-like protein 20 n=1 Tax=Helianthus annuus TaxID=4232 RepID=UPI000B8EFA81|nr:formin-like protein 20 [Helianthus annuus]